MAALPKISKVEAKPLDIDFIIGKPRNRIIKVGIELEGAWKNLPFDPEPDGSVFDHGANAPAGHKYGEVPLGPMMVGQLSTSVKKYYPNKIDHTCGLHVHMSFEKMLYYGWLMVPEYQETICKYLMGWAKEEGLPASHPIWDRLAGKSRFCRKIFWPLLQSEKATKGYNQEEEGNRYTIVNYAHKTHGTIEVRVLPMFEQADQALRGIRRVVDITNACLVVLAEKKVKHGVSVELPLGATYSESLEEII